MRKIAEADIWR